MKTALDFRRKAKMYEGFEILKHKVAMRLKTSMALFMIGSVVGGSIYSVVHLALLSEWFHPTLSMVKACFYAPIWPDTEIVVQGPNGPIYTTAYTYCDFFWPQFKDFVWNQGISALKYVVGCWFFFEVVGFVALRKKAQKELYDPHHIRGARMVDPKALAKKTRETKGPGPKKQPIKFGDVVSWPIHKETEHLFLMGAPGTGKTNALRQMLDTLRQRGEKAVIFDIKGDFVSLFFDSETDIILNPLDQRYPGWNPLLDITDPMLDAKDFATSFIPPTSRGGAEQYFRDAASDVLGLILKVVKLENDQATLVDVADTIARGPKELKEFLEAHPLGKTDPALAHIQTLEAGNQVGGIVSTIVQFTYIFNLLRGLSFSRFSLREFFKAEGPGFVFLSLPPAYTDLLKYYYGFAVSLLAKECLSWPDDIYRRRFFVLDELPALPKMPALLRIMREGRSKGVSVWVGTQTLEAIKEKYGKEGGYTIFDLNTKIFFRVNNPQDADLVSKTLGDVEIDEGSQMSHSMTADDNYDRLNASRHIVRRPLVLPVQLTEMENLHSILKIAGFPPSTIKWSYRAFDVREPAFVKREFQLPQKDQISHEESQEEISLF